MRRRNFLSGMSALGLSLLTAGCKRVAPIRIASHVWAGYEFMFLAQREGWISPQDTTLIKTRSATESMQLLATGKADGVALTLDEMLRAREQGIPLMAVLIFDISMGADALLAKPGLETLAQLKGKRIGYEQSAVGALMLHKALETAGLKPADVTVVQVTPDQHLQAWHQDKVDALITFEPISSQLKAENAITLFDSSKIPDTIFDVLAITPEVASHHAAALQQLVAAHFKGLSHFRKNPYDTAYRISESFKLPPKEVIGAFKGLELPNENRNRQLLRGPDATILRTAHSLNKIMTEAGSLKTGLSDFSRLASADFIPRENP